MVYERGAPPGIDRTKPSIARAYDAYLGGKDNYAVDRELVAQTEAWMPEARGCAVANRAFLRRVVRHLVRDAGIRQFLDLGSGLPTSGNVHEIAQAIDPGVRVVYVDNDPMVLVHARALLATNDTTAVLTSDVRRPREILEDPKLARYIDFDQPVGLLMFAILHHINDAEDPDGVAHTFRRALAPGSHLAISHFCDGSREYPDEAQRTAVTERIFNERLGTGRWRKPDEIEAFFGDFELADPGLVPVQDWRPELGDPSFAYHWLVGGVARKP